MNTSRARHRDISIGARCGLVVAGAGSWAVGCVATFMTTNAAPSSVLIVAGACVGGLGLMGRWPEKVVISGNEVSWPVVNDVLDEQIEVARSTGEDPDAVQELVDLRKRLDELQFSGQVSEHPAVAYDRDVAAAIHRVCPTGKLVQAKERSNREPDFVLQNGADRIFIETKWQSVESYPFRGRNLPALLESMPPGGRLVVVSNASNTRIALELVSESLGSRGTVVTWQGRKHDRQLRAALSSSDDEAARSPQRINSR
jgi:hypothetical protein